ncbi:extracellular solute-binding protein [Pseudokineococcus marinus]|uniref:Extracellular solute-binding protein n=1 Tax=Pseudokineococcus marinus TaxID=351215 RepID=A0A849BMY0_9ACTN|nr:extracellular solute-binding protein [Pseudokineococcus marinus]NNH24011.1 extracellular solute-binding protein [Pseudokineococcus marinus]
MSPIRTAHARTSRGPAALAAPSRRSFLVAVAAGLGSSAVLSGCVGSGGTESAPAGGGGASGGGGLVLQNSIQDEGPKAALTTLVEEYTAEPVTMNSVATEQFRAQLSTYLTSPNPPDVISWYAGSVANTYADQGLLLDVSDLWTGDGACASFPPALKALSTSGDDAQIFVPTNYYWWSIFYKKSAFEKWGVTPPETWDEFIALCEDLQGQGVIPLTNGIGTTPWMASGWFDYLDLRVNGAQYHRELLAGEHAFTDPEVVAVMDRYAEILPFFHPDQASWDNQQAAVPFVQDEAAMYLIGAFLTNYVPEDQLDDLDFFSVPVIDPSIPSAEEAPTDGFFASAGTADPEGTKAFLSYLASAESQAQWIAESGSANLPTNPDVDTSGFSPLVQKGIALLAGTEEITQFFNRDSSDALQTTADTALTQFIANPGDVQQILEQWQQAAEAVWSS